MSSIRHIHVACAIIEQQGLVLAALRSERMSLPLKWEFPGGKIEPGESPDDCLRRELSEEMSVHIIVGKSLPSFSHQYPAFAVTLYPFICTIESGEIVLHEHADIAWLSHCDLNNLDWAEADLPIIDYYLGLYDSENSLQKHVIMES